MMRWLPENVSTFGADVDGVIELIFWIVGAWLVLAMGVLLFFALRYRQSAGARAAYAPARTLRSMSVVLVPVALVLLFDLGIDTASTRAWDRIKVELPESHMTVRVIGKQFAWTFVHPGLDGVLDTADDISELNTLHVPVDRVVEFELQSEDVIHSFFLPNLRLKQDAVPGRTFKGWFEVTQTGRYQIVCAELCGLGHTNMRGWLQVYDEQGYNDWLATTEPSQDM